MLSFPKLALLGLELGGNKLGGEGLLGFCPGLAQNKSLTTLGMADNQILSRTVDVEALSLLASCVAKHPSLQEINLLYNPIEEAGASALLPAAENKNIIQFLLDTNVPEAIYRQLYRSAPAKNLSKKKKKKGKNTKKVGR